MNRAYRFPPARASEDNRSSLRAFRLEFSAAGAIDPAMEISEKSAGPVLILTLNGRLDATGAETFRKTVEERIREGVRAVVVDFQGVNFLASLGIRALLVPSQRLAQAGGRLAITGLGPSVASVFSLSGLDSVFRIYPSVDEAVQDGPWPERAA